jgi:hypothetical protein
VPVRIQISFVHSKLSDHFYLYKLLAPQYLRTRETVCTIAASPRHPYRSHTHMADRVRLVHRYSNTLLVSLNNRISIRDTHGVHGGLVDCQDVAGPSISNNSRPKSTTETMITDSEIEKPQEDLMRQLEPVPEAEIEEWVIGESCVRHIIVPYFSYLEQLRDPRLQISRDTNRTN